MAEDGLRPNYGLLELAATGSDRMVDPRLAEMLRELARPSAIVLLAEVWAAPDAEVARVRTGLHRALDWAAHAAWASDFLMNVLNIEWKRLGGSHDDPAPWREEPPFSED